MFWMDNPSGVQQAPVVKPVHSQTRLYFTEGGNGQTPSYPGDEWFNMVTDELLNVVTEAGLTPEKATRTQLAEAIKAIITSNMAGDASATVKGLVRFATTAESAAALSSSLAVPPAHLPAVIAKYAPVAGGYRNLRLSADGASANVLITADQLVLDSVGSAGPLLTKSVNLTAVATASGANGLDTGALAASTWYSVWVISNGTTVASLLSLSATAPTMPSGYVYRRKIGWIITDSANKFPMAFLQHDTETQYVVGVNPAVSRVAASGVQGSISVPTFVQISLSAFVPPEATFVMASLGGVFNGTSAIAAPNAAYPKVSNPASNTSPLHLSQSSSAGATHMGTTAKIMLESINLFYASSAQYSHLQILGWEISL